MGKALATCSGLILLMTAPGTALAQTFSIAQGSAVGTLTLAQASGQRSPASGSVANGDWAYTVRPGDKLKSLSDRLLDDRHSWSELLRHNNLSADKSLHAGQVLKIPLRWLRHQPRPATALAVTGKVYYRSQEHSFATLHSGVKLNVGDEVHSDQGHAVIELADKSVVRLAAHSTLLFNRLTQYGQTGMADTRMRLRKGSLSTDVHPLSDPHSSFEIETPSAVAAVRGTAFRLHAGTSGTRLEVTRGKVAFSNSFRQSLVHAGFGAHLSSTGGFREQRLPPKPPAPASPGSLTRLPVKLTWRPVAAASAYQLDLFNTKTGAWLRSERLTRSSVTLSDLRNGPYRAELAAVSTSGMEGLPSPVTFSVALKARAATLQSPADGTRVHKGPVHFAWQFQGNNQQARVQVSTSKDFSKLAAQSPWLTESGSSMSKSLGPGVYYWRVETRAGGSSRATSQVSSFVVPGKLPEVRIITANYVKNQVRIFWRQVPAVDAYRLQLSANANFTKIIREETLDSNTVALRLIPGRHYFVRLKPVSSGPLKSIWGPARELYVE